MDRERSEYIKKYFDVEWPARHYFHLMINTTMGEEIVVETLLHSVSVLEKAVICSVGKVEIFTIPPRFLHLLVRSSTSSCTAVRRLVRRRRANYKRRQNCTSGIHA